MNLNEKFKMLPENRWVKYDAKKMRKKKGVGIAAILLILWWLEFQIFLFAIDSPIWGISPEILSAIFSTIIIVVAIVVIWAVLKRIDIQKDGWYFSAYRDKGLNWETLVSFIWAFLKENGYLFEQEKVHKTGTLKITYFDLKGKDFKIRLWFSTVNGVPVVEIGIGPENLNNREEIEKLREKISAAFKEKIVFGEV